MPDGQSIFSTPISLPGFGSGNSLDLLELDRLRVEKDQRHDARHAATETSVAALLTGMDEVRAAIVACTDRIVALELATAPKPKVRSEPLPKTVPEALVDQDGQPWLDPDGKPLMDDDPRLQLDKDSEIITNADGSPKLKPVALAPAAPAVPLRRKIVL